MDQVVVDASVVVKWYIPEKHHEQARNLRNDFLEGTCELLAPALMPFEAVNALKYSGQYDGERLEEAADSLGMYGIELVPFRSGGPIAAITTAAEVTAYDAAYIALAVDRRATAFTADSKLLAELEGTEYEEAVDHVRSY